MRDTIFKNQTVSMPPPKDQVARTSQVIEDTDRMANVPGGKKIDGHGVVSVDRPRRGHGY